MPLSRLVKQLGKEEVKERVDEFKTELARLAERRDGGWRMLKCEEEFGLV